MINVGLLFSVKNLSIGLVLDLPYKSSFFAIFFFLIHLFILNEVCSGLVRGCRVVSAQFLVMGVTSSTQLCHILSLYAKYPTWPSLTAVAVSMAQGSQIIGLLFFGLI